MLAASWDVPAIDALPTPGWTDSPTWAEPEHPSSQAEVDNFIAALWKTAPASEPEPAPSETPTIASPESTGRGSPQETD
jgi:hypothetical protein